MTTAPWLARDVITFMLLRCQTWAVVGLSGNPHRPAFRVAEFLLGKGKRIVPIHPEAHEVLGEQGYASLAEVPFGVDCVDVFRRSEAAGEHADQAVELGAKGVWFQLGVVDRAAYERTTAAGVAMVMDSCPKVEWPRTDWER